MDLYGRRCLGTLLERLATETGAKWIRLHYTFPSSFPADVVEVMKKYADLSLKKANSQSISMRLSRLMQNNCISAKKLCLCTGINEKHLEQFFQGVSHLTDEEIALLSGFFGVTTDYILKGDSDWIKH